MAQPVYKMVGPQGQTIYETDDSEIAAEWSDAGFRVTAEVQ